jgi:hypothetical protein
VCGWDRTKNADVAQADTHMYSASDTIDGSNVTLSASVTYPRVDGTELQEEYAYVEFGGSIARSGNLLLASSGLQGIQDYTFVPTTNGVAQVQNQFRQGTCNS